MPKHRCRWGDGAERCTTLVPYPEVMAFGAAICSKHQPEYEAERKRVMVRLEANRAALKAKYDPGCLADEY